MVIKKVEFNTGSLRNVPGWFVTTVVVVVVVVVYMTSASTLRVKKLAAGKAVSNFRESDEAGKRAEAVMSGTRPSTKTADCIPG